MISTKTIDLLPDIHELKKICKAISVLDAIICQEWQYRYYSYNSKWDENEECFQMRNGSGDEMFVWFTEDASVINGFAHEFQQNDKKKLTQNLPEIFNGFMFGEPVNSIGTTFCIWNDGQNKWKTGIIDDFNDNSSEMLSIFDGNPQTYIDWAKEYYEDAISENISLFETVSAIYQNKALTKKMILKIAENIDDWKQLEDDLLEINYPFRLD